MPSKCTVAACQGTHFKKGYCVTHFQLQEPANTARSEWVRDGDVLVCSSSDCNQAFSLLVRKHHCRGCGCIFCGPCSSSSVALPHLGYQTPVRVCKACEETAKRRTSFAEDHLTTLIKGGKFKKHACGVGLPHDKFIKLDYETMSLVWDEKTLPVREITQIQAGKTSKAFARTGKKSLADCCFSVVSTQRTLDLECPSSAIRDQWVAALQKALEFAPIEVAEDIKQENIKASAEARSNDILCERREKRRLEKEKLMAKYKK